MHTLGFVVLPGFQLMGLTAITAFEIANLTLGKPAYEVTLLSEVGGLVMSSAGFRIETRAFASEQVFDTVMFGSGTSVMPVTAGLANFVRASMTSARRVAAPCVGAFVLAESGVLDGRRATTHWLFAKRLQDQYPKVKVEPDRIYIIDGPVWTSAGMTASIDLALAMIEKDHGLETARIVARKLVVYHRRAGGQSQFSVLLDLEPKSDRIQKALDYARRNLTSALSVEELAEVSHLSPRQFSRAFTAETGQSPAKAVEHLRVEAARMLLEDSGHSIEVVAREAGFADRERMRRAFLRTIGQTPQMIRRSGTAVV
ncbi:GlxA family transcriptional regulator [Pseudomonas sp. CC120222-01a]|uniref:GlxA family transcriptional regulator n=1 Tax=Pseudomonas sp. CC120222-01a TaxID=1378075 RepID=UPI000D9E3113|nr:GlxA family transcriptional regulator [Pseudomonas sp. CC120222-01a]PVZ41061.1 transcriptional regulator GlxA family with amidase domain [Pseudomonas sp. CC120222-01a]